MLRNPRVWLAALLGWFGTLWILSSMSGVGPNVSINHLDKVAHFIYFFGGGVLLAGWRFRYQPVRPSWKLILTTTILTMALIGWLDEWHQSFTPGRSGNDPFDWLADLLGATAGAFALKAFHRFLR
ncbi:MAG: VanZ family protein [Gloeobacteraceae cyanobacterium ES-bin-144]|nr:VanZ family protein [Verrucomicrobiales bacterium]